MVSRTRIIALAIGLFLFAGALLVVYIKQRPGIRSIAVLPFEVHRSNDRSQMPSGEAIARNLTTMLTQDSNLEVVPMVSSKHVAGQVDAVVEGRIIEDGSRLVVSVSLHGREEGRVLWSEELREPAGDPVFVERHLASILAPMIINAVGDPGALTDVPFGPDPEADRLIEQGWKELWEDEFEADRRAEELFREGLTLDPGSTMGYMGLANVTYRRAGFADLTEAIRNFELALRLDRNLIAARRGLAKCYWGLGQFENCLGMTLQIPPTTPRLDRLILLGEAYCLCGLPDQAIPVLEEARELEPEDEGILWHLVMAYNFGAERRKTIEAGLDFLSRFDDDLFVHQFVAESYHVLGIPDSAIAHYEAASANRQNGNSHFINMAALYRQIGDEDRAQEALRREIEASTGILEMFPGRPAARSRLALAYALAGDLENHARIGAKIEQDSGTNWLYGLSLAALGDEERAVAYFRRALDMKNNFYLPIFGKDESGLQLWGVPHLADNPEFRAFVEEAHRDLERLRSKY